MTGKSSIVHITHEATGKIGGIGAVLEGLYTSRKYLDATGRQIIIGPLFHRDSKVENRLGPEGEVLYSSIDGKVRTQYDAGFQAIEDRYNVDIVYGRRRFVDNRTGVHSEPEVILIDIGRIDAEPVNKFKGALYNEFGIASNLYEHLWEYEQYIRLAPPAIAVLKAIGVAGRDTHAIIVAHEFMGMPTALAAMLDSEADFKTVFYAHEVATVRRIVEEHPGHDTMFYNVMNRARKEGLWISDVFGDQNGYFKHVLVSAARFCDNILAVGDFVCSELRWLSPEFEYADIDLTYNGIPAYQIDIAEKKASRNRLISYCENILGYKPDHIFTHVTRLVRSKGLWRDLDVLMHIDREFRTLNKTAVMFVLSTEVGPRRPVDILRMESQYDWPVAHREGLPDLSGGEAAYYAQVQAFNARSRNIKVVFINQFGFTRERCGNKMPADIETSDIRKGTDVEFGLSVYEPFGIAQLEPLTYGGICVPSNICGCAGFASTTTNGENVRNIIIANYTDLDGVVFRDIDNLTAIDDKVRKQIEGHISKQIALEICARLPANDNDFAKMTETGYDIAEHMGWDTVVENYILPSLRKAAEKLHCHKMKVRIP